jgi:hypothetical protein
MKFSCGVVDARSRPARVWSVIVEAPDIVAAGRVACDKVAQEFRVAREALRCHSQLRLAPEPEAAPSHG